MKHSGQPLCFFCRWCAELICRDCTVLDHCQTEGHDVVDVHEVFEEEKCSLINMTRSANAAIQTRRDVVNRLQREATNMTATKDAALTSIQQSFSEFSAILQQRQAFLTDATHAIYRQKSQLLQEKMEEILTNVACLVSGAEVCSDLLLATSLTELLTVKDSIMPQMTALLSQDYSPTTGATYLHFNNHTGVRTFKMAADNLGKVEVGKSLPSRIVLVDSSNHVPGFTATVSVQAVDVKGKALINYPITADVTDPDGDAIPSQITDSGNLYHVSFAPQIPGQHSIQFYFMGLELDIQHSTVERHEAMLVIGGRGSQPGQFQYPFSIAVDNDDNIYVGDSGNCRVQKFSPTGLFLDEIRIEPAARAGDDEEEDEYPLSVFDVAIDQQGHLVISLGDSICDEASEEEEEEEEVSDAESLSSSDSDADDPHHDDHDDDEEDLVYALPSASAYSSRERARHAVTMTTPPALSSHSQSADSTPSWSASSSLASRDRPSFLSASDHSPSLTHKASHSTDDGRPRARVSSSTSLPAIGGASGESHLTRSPSTDRYGSLGRRRNRFRNHSSVSEQQYDLDMKPGPQGTTLIEETVYIAINGQRHFVTSAFQEETLTVYDRYGQHLLTAAETPHLSTPQKVCIGQNQEMVLADAGNHRVKIYSQAGHLLKQIGHKGRSKGKLHELHGVAVDTRGQIVVSDEANKRLQVFTRAGKLVSVITSRGAALRCPTGLCVTRDGHVLVVDTTAHKIYKFKYC